MDNLEEPKARCYSLYENVDLDMLNISTTLGQQIRAFLSTLTDKQRIEYLEIESEIINLVQDDSEN